jgi:hypothetical protein
VGVILLKGESLGSLETLVGVARSYVRTYRVYNHHSSSLANVDVCAGGLLAVDGDALRVPLARFLSTIQRPGLAQSSSSAPYSLICCNNRVLFLNSQVAKAQDGMRDGDSG